MESKERRELHSIFFVGGAHVKCSVEARISARREGENPGRKRRKVFKFGITNLP
jgi:hypothetical protein